MLSQMALPYGKNKSGRIFKRICYNQCKQPQLIVSETIYSGHTFDYYRSNSAPCYYRQTTRTFWDYSFPFINVVPIALNYTMAYDERSDGSSSSEAQESFQRSMSTKMGSQQITMPKHIPFPEHATTSEWLSELIMCAFTMGAAIVQFINIYRTNWWLPQFNSRHMVVRT